MSILLGLVAFVAGYVLLLICGILKINSLRGLVDPSVDNSSLIVEHKLILIDDSTSDFDIPQGVSNTTIRNTTPAVDDYSISIDYSILPVTVYLGILGFIFLDIGYDMSLSLSRAYALDCIPKGQQTQILMTSTLMQALGGLVVSFCGIFDYPTYFTRTFNVEGLAATTILFSGGMILITILGFTATIVTGYVYDPNLYVEAKGGKIYDSFSSEKQGHSYFAERPTIEVEQSKRREGRKISRDYRPDILHTAHGDTVIRPLFLEGSLSLSSYSSTASSIKSAFIDSLNKVNRNRRDPVGIMRGANGYQRINSVDDTQHTNDQSTQTSIALFKAQHSRSVSLSNITAKNIPNPVLPETILEKNNEEPKQSLCPKINGRMAVVLCSTFLAFGSSMSFNLYIANSITVGVYHGDPEAPPGSEGRQLYEEGVRTAAFGNLLSYIVYLILSIWNKTIIDMFGKTFLPVLFLISIGLT